MKLARAVPPSPSSRFSFPPSSFLQAVTFPACRGSAFITAELGPCVDLRVAWDDPRLDNQSYDLQRAGVRVNTASWL